ncbi:MAG: hypothetical protein O3B64_03220 [bacterium]|nr:hypothetical protein [bacterium]
MQVQATLPEVTTQITDLRPNAPDFRIEQLFGSKTRSRLLSLFLESPDRAFYVREVTRRIDAQLNSVRRELKNLIDIGIIDEVDGAIVKGEKPDKKGAAKKYYRANKHFLFFVELRSIMKKATVLMNRTLLEKLTGVGKIDLVFLTGRFVDKKNLPSDLLVVGEINTELLAEIMEGFEKDIGREVNYTFMPREEYRYRTEVQDRFLGELLGAEKIVLHNELDQRL